MWNPKLILGGPGCGKTTRLLEIVESEMAAGVGPAEIAFVTFTKAGANEGRRRAAQKFGFDEKRDLPHFRTIHSMAYDQLDIARDEVMGPRDWQEFSELVGYNLTGYFEKDGAIIFGGKEKNGDAMLRIIDFAATTGMSLEMAWHHLGDAIDWHILKHFADTFAQYKRDSGKLDFTDMVSRYATEGNPIDGIRVAAIDEAQDLTHIQWLAVKRAFSNVERLYIVGDDDQAIYKWAGADIDTFLGISNEPEILLSSHRLPRTIHRFGQLIAGRINKRFEKPYRPRDAEGRVEFHQQPESVDLSNGRWLLLARNSYHLERLESQVRDSGYTYATRHISAVVGAHVEAMFLWERIRSGKQKSLTSREVRLITKSLGRPIPAIKERAIFTPAQIGIKGDLDPWYDALLGIDQVKRQYYAACLRSKEKLREELVDGVRPVFKPRIRIETIHGVKGAEEDNVLVLTDMTAKTQAGYELDPDAEHRVFYVAVTRAKETLHIIAPQGDRYYDMPLLDNSAKAS